MNCPANRPSQPPPFPRTRPTPFFKIWASPSAAENTELINESLKNVESIAEQSEDPGTKRKLKN